MIDINLDNDVLNKSISQFCFDMSSPVMAGTETFIKNIISGRIKEREDYSGGTKEAATELVKKDTDTNYPQLWGYIMENEAIKTYDQIISDQTEAIQVIKSQIDSIDRACLKHDIGEETDEEYLIDIKNLVWNLNKYLEVLKRLTGKGL